MELADCFVYVLLWYREIDLSTGKELMIVSGQDKCDLSNLDP